MHSSAPASLYFWLIQLKKEMITFVNLQRDVVQLHAALMKSLHLQVWTVLRAYVSQPPFAFLL